MLSIEHAAIINGWFALYVTANDTYIAAFTHGDPDRFFVAILGPEAENGDRELTQYPVMKDRETAANAALRTFLELP